MGVVGHKYMHLAYAKLEGVHIAIQSYHVTVKNKNTFVKGEANKDATKIAEGG